MVHTYGATAASGMPTAPSTRPIVSFVVPCYNSAAYMRTCIDSLVPAEPTTILHRAATPAETKSRVAMGPWMIGSALVGTIAWGVVPDWL